MMIRAPVHWDLLHMFEIDATLFKLGHSYRAYQLLIGNQGSLWDGMYFSDRLEHKRRFMFESAYVRRRNG